MKQILAILLLIISIAQTTAQTITGQLKQHAGQTISLTGFDYYKNVELATTTADSLGNFTLNYPKTYNGMGVLKTQDNNSLVLALLEPVITLKGTHLTEPNKVQYINSPKNQQFFSMAMGFSIHNNVYQAWRFLQPLYKDQSPLNQQKKVLATIQQELTRIETASQKEINTLPKQSYLYWFMPLKKLVNDMPQTVYKYPERIPQNIQQFRTTDFKNPNFKTSGLFKDLIEGHYMLLENSGGTLDEINAKMDTSTDYLLQNLQQNDSLLNTVSKELLSYFEKRSLFPAAAHLSNQLLTDNKCVLNDSLAKTMQKYVSLKVGNTAPDIQLDNKKLSDIKKPVLLVFGASWCPHCKDEALQLLNYYDTWKTKKDLEVVYISIDTNKNEFETAYKNAPWQTYCDYKGWNTQAAKDYFVNATPTYILLDKDLKILVHPSSLAQVDTWVNYQL